MSRTTGKRTSRQPGFTLLELLLVITLMAVLTSVAYPRLSNTARAAQLEQGTERLAEVVRFARTAAVQERLKVRLNLSTDGREYWLSVQDGENVLREQFTEFGDSFLDNHWQLPGRVHVEKIVLNGAPGPPTHVSFNPDGVSEPVEVRLVDEEDRRGVIELGPMTEDVQWTIRRGQAES